MQAVISVDEPDAGEICRRRPGHHCVNVDSEPDEAAAFLRDYPADFEIIYDPTGDIAQEFGVSAMPSSYIFDRKGDQVTRHLGFKVRQQDEYETLLMETLSQ